MKRSPSLNRLILVLCIVVLALAALTAQMFILQDAHVYFRGVT
jgi:hypothetical protein